MGPPGKAEARKVDILSQPSMWRGAESVLDDSRGLAQKWHSRFANARREDTGEDISEANFTASLGFRLAAHVIRKVATQTRKSCQSRFSKFLNPLTRLR